MRDSAVFGWAFWLYAAGLLVMTIPGPHGWPWLTGLGASLSAIGAVGILRRE